VKAAVLLYNEGMHNSLESKKIERDPFADQERIDALYKEAVEEMDRFRPNPEDFGEFYDVEEIKNDQREIARLEKQWEERNSEESQEAKKIATLAEYLLFKYLSVWTDGHAHLSPTCEFDDYVNKVDMILECPSGQEDETYHAMTIDVVMGSIERLTEKLMRIKMSLDTKKEPVNVKYFKGEDGKLVRPSSFVAGVVSLSAGVVRNLVSKEFAGQQQGLEPHHAAYIMVTELLEQYAGFRQYALYVGNQEVADEYEVATENLKNAFKPLLIQLEQDADLQEVVEGSDSVKNVRTFFKILREEYMTHEINKAA
jgi:hypothetical protein